MEVTIVLPRNECERDKIIEKLDKHEDYGDYENVWLRYNNRIGEMIFEEDGNLQISAGSDNVPSVFLDIPFSELIQHFKRFNFFGSFFDYIEDNFNKFKKDKVVFNDLKELFKIQVNEDLEKQIKKYKRKLKRLEKK